MTKISAYPEDTSPNINGYALGDDTTPTTKKTKWQNIALMIAAFLFGSSITSYANAGTAGGTFYYLSVGGWKLLWGTTGTITVSGSNQQFASYGVTLPTGFFSSLQSVQTSLGPIVNSQAVTVHVNNQTTSQVVMELWQAHGTNGGGYGNLFIIGS